MNRQARRRLANSAAMGAMILLAVLAFIPLFLVLAYTTINGVPAVMDVNFFAHTERPVGIPGGGIAHAIFGSLIMVGLASVLAIPLGILAGVHLAEYGGGRVGLLVRLASDVLVGTPSIAIGLFAYTVLVAPVKHFSALSAAVALAILMLPVVLRTTEGALNLVPSGLREAGTALGLPRWKVSLRLLLPAALPAVITGCLLAMARAAGETAPLLFTAFGNAVWSLDPVNGPMSALPLIVFRDALKPYPELQRQAWGAALVLVALVLVANLATRFALRRQSRLAAQLS